MKVLFSRVSVCPHPEGTPSSSHNSSTSPMGEYFHWGIPQWLVPDPFMGRGHPVPRRGYPVLAGGYPSMGYLPLRQVSMAYPLGQDRMGYPPPPAMSWWGTSQPANAGWGTPPRDRTAERALAARRAVCLLRLRRSTVLLILRTFNFNYINQWWEKEREREKFRF